MLTEVNQNQQNGNSSNLAATTAAEKFVSGSGDTPEQITVYANSQTGKANPLIGFIIGITYEPLKYDYNKTIELISALKPRFWRFANNWNDVYGFIEKGNFVSTYNTKLMFVMEDAVHIQRGYNITISPGCASNTSDCFQSFADFKTVWTNISTIVMKEMVQKNYPIQYFEVFGEPVNNGFGQANTDSGISGITSEQLMDLYKTTHTIIRSAKPTAKVGGPGWIRYNKELLSGFLDYLVSQNIPLDFLSWHEFGTPEEMAAHVAEARQLISARPQLCNPNCPEIHITEFSPGSDLHIPSTGLVWFYYLEKANVNWASRACWDVVKPDGTQGDICWSTIDGMLMQDNVTTTDMYWVYKLYADMDNTRVRTDSTKPHTVAISDRDDSQKEVRVLVGRYGYNGAASDVKISVKDYPFGNGNVSAEIWRIPANGTLYRQTALANPIRIESQELHSANGEMTLNIGSFKDGEVYYVLFKPMSSYTPQSPPPAPVPTSPPVTTTVNTTSPTPTIPVASTPTPNASSIITATTFETVKFGTYGSDNLLMQKVFNEDSYTKIASSGPGSPGLETTYYGVLTRRAVIKFQEKYASEVLIPLGLTKGTGYVGPATKKKLREVAKQMEF